MATIQVKSEITGKVWKIEAQKGQQLVEGDTVMLLESMKMEIPLVAPNGGILKDLLVAEGDSVSEGQDVALMDT